MKLADIIETFISGDWGEETVAEDTPNSVFCIRGADIVPITNHCFNGIPQRFVCDKTIENKTLKAGDLIIEKSGGSPTQSTGRIVYVSEDLIKAKGNVVCSNFCTAFRVKAGWNPLYVYYFWQNVYNHGAFFNFEGKTSGIKNLQLDNALSAIDIEYLPLEKQNQIVTSLTSIDEKIKVNRQINDNLEAMAKQLYDYWFVQFDFPNEEGKPYKSSGGAVVWNERLKCEIPQGWSGVSLKDLALTSRNAITPVENEVYQHFSIPSFDACGSYSLDNGSDIKSDKFVLQEGQLLVSKLNPWFNRVVWVPKGTNMIGSTEFVVLNPNNESESGYIYSVIKSPKFIAYCSQAATGTSHSQRRVSPDVLMAFKVGYEQGVVQKYGCLIEKIQKQQAELLSEIAILTKQRDELLPLLMNGQATVNYHLSASFHSSFIYRETNTSFMT